MPENRGTFAIHGSMRHVDTRARKLQGGRFQRAVHRHRRRAKHRKRAEHLFLPPAQHESYDEKRRSREPAAHRRIRQRNRAAHRRSTGRIHTETLHRRRHIRHNNHTLPEPETLRRRTHGSGERSHALRPGKNAGALPAANRAAGQFVRSRDCAQDRHTRRRDSRRFENCWSRIHTKRQIPARHCTRQTLLGTETPESTPAGKTP